MLTNTQPKDIRTLAYIIKRTNYGEADRVLNILTPEGKLSAMAKGVRKEKSKLAGNIEMFCLIDMNIHQGKNEFGVVTGARMLKYYSNLVIDLPRMELKCVTSLIEPLKAMDVTDAFASEADFPGIAEGAVSVSEFKQLTFLEITEKGTDAINPDDKPFDGGDITVRPLPFTVNRPFFFTIRESKSNTIIFMGKVRKL